MAALNFPNTRPDSSPLQAGDQYTGDNGVTYIYDGVKWIGRTPGTAGTSSLNNNGRTVQVDTTGNLVLGVGATIVDTDGNIVSPGVPRSDAAPNTTNGQLWFNTVDGRMYIKNNNAWIDANPVVIPEPEQDIAVTTITFPDETVQTTAWTGIPDTLTVSTIVFDANTSITGADGVLSLNNGMLIGTLWPNIAFNDDKESVVWAPSDSEYLGLWYGGNIAYPVEGYGPKVSINIGKMGIDDGFEIVDPIEEADTGVYVNVGQDYEWFFGPDGKLHLPPEGDIVNSIGTSVLGGSGGSVGDFVITNTTLSAAPGSVSATNKEISNIAWNSGDSTYVVTYSTAPGYGYHTKVIFGGTNISQIEGSGQTFYLNPYNNDPTQYGVYSDYACTIKVDGSGFDNFDSAPPAYTTELVTGAKITIKTGTPANNTDPGAIEFKIGGKTYGWTIDKDNHLRLPADGGASTIKNYYGNAVVFQGENIRFPDNTVQTTAYTGGGGGTGATGATGVTGATGSNGTNGATGATGADSTVPGATGATGVAGDPGTPGMDGATGATGADSTVPGATGATGVAGDPGTPGMDGATGATGDPGTPGMDGATGATGDAGTPGMDGATGATGASGVGLSPIPGDNAVSTALTPGTYSFTSTLFLGYQIPNDPWADGQYITLADTTPGSTLVYSGILNFVAQGVGTVGFYLGTIISVVGTPVAGTSSTWLMSFAAAPAGATGPQGDTGATGASGIDGATGASGIDGATGSTGPIGATGAGAGAVNEGSAITYDYGALAGADTGNVEILSSTYKYHWLLSLTGNPDASRNYYLPPGSDGDAVYFMPGNGFDPVQNTLHVTSYKYFNGTTFQASSGNVQLFGTNVNNMDTLVRAFWFNGSWQFTGNITPV